MDGGNHKSLFSHILPYLVIFIIGTSLSFALFFSLRHQEQASLAREFHRIAENRKLSLERLIRNKLSILESVRAFFESSQFVDRQEFSSFTSSFSGFEGFFAIEWIPRVNEAQREEFEAGARSAGFPDFFIKEKNEQGEFVPAQKHDDCFPIYYIEPVEGNQNALGFDYASDPLRYRVILEARDRGCAVATEKIRLVQDQQNVSSFIVFLPLYKKGMPISTVQERRENLEGFVAGAFHVYTLVESAMSYADVQDISVCVSDTSDPDHECLCCYSNKGCSLGEEAGCLINGDASSEISFEALIDVATRQWRVVCQPQPGLIALYETRQPEMTLAIGLLVTGIVFIFYWFLSRRTETLQRLVNQRTEELSRELEQRNRAEKELSELAKKLKAKNAELQNVVYIASHDLKSPLVTISGFCNELEGSCGKLRSLFAEKLNDENRSAVDSLFETSISESLKFIHAGVEKTKMLIDGLLQVSRAGTSPFHIERIDMNETIKNVIENHSFQAKECGAEISVDVLPDCFGDGPKTNQVFSNLLTNALKYLSPKRPGRIRISGTTKDNRSIYCVADNGIGIPPEHQSRVFEVFHRVHLDASVNVSGDGLGLSIVSRILEGQNGEIWLESEVGQGSKFYVSLPTA